MTKRILASVLALLMLIASACAEVLCDGEVALTDDVYVEYGLEYSSKDEVALYLHAFCELPPNYITKKQAQALGWDSSLGNLWSVASGASIGGDRFGNREGLLPDAENRQWYECDIGYEGGYRGALRLLFSSDGLICFSGDHYTSYTLLYEGWYFEGVSYPLDAPWSEYIWEAAA